MSYIYRSNLQCADLQPYFRCAEREGPFGHTVLYDPELSGVCNFATHDEAAVLGHIVRRVDYGSGKWLEIGTHTGWTAAHMASGLLAGSVVCLEPDPRCAAMAALHLYAHGCPLARVFPLTSEQWASDFGPSDMWIRPHHGAFIDGNHDSPEPLNDAKRVLPFLSEHECAIIFHDFAGRSVREAVRHLIGLGFKFRVYNTPQMLAVCWRGEITMPNHVPDPKVDWQKVREGFSDFDFGAES